MAYFSGFAFGAGIAAGTVSMVAGDGMFAIASAIFLYVSTVAWDAK